MGVSFPSLRHDRTRLTLERADTQRRYPAGMVTGTGRARVAFADQTFILELLEGIPLLVGT